MKNICVIGHANEISVNENNSKWADVIVEWIYKNNFRLTTGGCIGIPEIVAKKLLKMGGKVLAYSPARNERENITEYGFSTNQGMEMKYLVGNNSSKNARFLYRSIDLIEDADLVICFKGTWGTLSEIVFAVMCGKKILFLNIDNDNNDLKKIYEIMQNINLTDWNEKFIEINSIEKLKIELNMFENFN